MNEDCFVTQIRKKRYKNGEIPQSAIIENTEEKQLRRERLLNDIVTNLVDYMINYLPTVEDDVWNMESLHQLAGYLQGSRCLENDQIDCILDALKILIYGVKTEEESYKKLSFNFDDIKPESDIMYGCDASFRITDGELITKFREDNVNHFKYEDGLKPEDINEAQLCREKILGRMFEYIITMVLKYTPNLSNEQGFKIDKKSFWRDCSKLEANFSKQQSERIMEIVKLCLYNLVEEMKGYEQQNSVSKS